MTLASALLKRYFIAKSTGRSWDSISFARRGDPKHGKPCLAGIGPKSPGLDFNVSHQAGIVALVGTTSPDVDVGVDVVCANERDDLGAVRREGFVAWVDIYGQVLSPAEVRGLKESVPDSMVMGDEVELDGYDKDCLHGGTVGLKDAVRRKKDGMKFYDEDVVLKARIRRFYTLWCYKEAYVKMTGEALLANWIQELEFENVRAPGVGTVEREKPEEAMVAKRETKKLTRWGEVVEDVVVRFKRKVVDDVDVRIRAFEENYMIAMAVRPKEAAAFKGDEMTFREVDVEDIVLLAQSQMAGNVND